MAKRTKTRNKFEQKIEDQLKSKKVDYKYEPYYIPYTLARRYLPDFSIRNGSILLEVKGYLRPEDRSKMAAVKKQNPELDLRIIFYSKKEKDIKWAEKIGLPWAIGSIPKEWLK